MGLGDTTVIEVTTWVDAVVDNNGHDPRSRYVEDFWLPVLGPTATWLLRRFAHALDAHPGGLAVDLDDTARCMGLTYTPGRHSPFVKALQRLTMFGVSHQTAAGIAVRRTVPDVAHRHLRRLPDTVQATHLAHVGASISLDDFSRAHTIGLAMRDCGDGAEVIEHQLVAIGTHHSIAEAVAANFAALDSTVR